MQSEQLGLFIEQGGMSDRRLARKSGASSSLIRALRLGTYRSRLRPYTITKLSQALGIPPEPTTKPTTDTEPAKAGDLVNINGQTYIRVSFVASQMASFLDAIKSSIHEP